MSNFKLSVAGAVLALTSTAAMAVPGPIPLPDQGPGGLIVSAWDPIRNLGTTTYLGLTLDEFQVDDRSPETGLTLDFAVDLSVFGGNLNGVVYNVVGADFEGSTFSPLDWQASFTAPNLPLSAFPAYNGDALANMSAVINTFIIRVNQACPTEDGCDALNGTVDHYPNSINYGPTLAAATLGLDSTAAIGSSLAFYMMTGISDITPDLVDFEQYANSLGAAEWLLTADGNLRYSIAGAPVVPLPAAVWLLLSGLAGVGVVSRRRPAGVSA
jgi:hypothetical protein